MVESLRVSSSKRLTHNLPALATKNIALRHQASIHAYLIPIARSVSAGVPWRRGPHPRRPVPGPQVDRGVRLRPPWAPVRRRLLRLEAGPCRPWDGRHRQDDDGGLRAAYLAHPQTPHQDDAPTGFDTAVGAPRTPARSSACWKARLASACIPRLVKASASSRQAPAAWRSPMPVISWTASR